MRGLRPLSLEGFSEDVNEDGFVDPVGQAVAPVVTYAPHAAPLVHHTYAAAPAVYTVPHVYQTVHHVPQVHVQKAVSPPTTHHVITHAPVIGAYAGLPAVAVAAAAPAVEAEADAAVEAAVSTHTTHHVINH